jgi:predicted membrane protein
MIEKSYKVSYAGLFLALGLFLPFLTGQVPEIGNMLLPMHLGVMLCGLICGPFWGLGIGFLTPLLRSLIFGMPVLFPNAFAMAFELATYGFVIGIIYKIFKKNKFVFYFALIISMIAGRIVWGLVSVCFYGLAGKAFTFEIFLAGAFTKSVPGIILQLLLIPIIMYIYKKSKLNNETR